MSSTPPKLLGAGSRMPSNPPTPSPAQGKTPTSTSTSRFFKPPPKGLATFPPLTFEEEEEDEEEDDEKGVDSDARSDEMSLDKLTPPPSSSKPLTATQDPAALVLNSRGAVSRLVLQPTVPTANTGTGRKRKALDFEDDMLLIPEPSSKRKALNFEEEMLSISPHIPSASASQALAPRAKPPRTAAEIRSLAPNSRAELPKMIVYHKYIEAKLEEAMNDPLPTPEEFAMREKAAEREEEEEEEEQKEDGMEMEEEDERELARARPQPLRINIATNAVTTADESWSMVEDSDEFGVSKKK